MEENRIELASYWMEKEYKSLETAKHEFSLKNIDFCVNWFYYAVFLCRP